MKEQKYSINNLSQKQLNIIAEALESLSRNLAGQFDNGVLESFKFKRSYPAVNPKANWDKLRELTDNIKKEIFPQLNANASFGIGHPELHDDSNISYELYRIINKYLIDRKEMGLDKRSLGINVNREAPLHYSKEELVVLSEDNTKN